LDDDRESIVNEWVENQIREFQRLTGRRISRADGVETAIREDDGTGAPQFVDKEVPCLQLTSLYLHLDDGAIAEVGTYQDAEEWGLSLAWSSVPGHTGFDGAFRFRAIPELPAGLVTRVAATRNARGNLSEVGLFIEGCETKLVAGEIYEGSDEPLVFCRDDESILVFPKAADVSRVRWR